MRMLILLLGLLMSTGAWAEMYLVFQYNPDARVVLGQGNCLIKGLTGGRASVQLSNGKFIRGCWKYIDNNANVRIDWENPVKPGDFAVLRARDFTPVDE